MFVWFLLWNLFVVSTNVLAKPSIEPILIQAVDSGETAKIICPSNDDNHRFQFWQLKTNEILGPSNKVNARKYKYEVWSGTLYIKKVTPKEEGTYTCYSKHLSNQTLSAKSVILEVNQDWQRIWGDDGLNMFRMGIMLAVASIIGLALYVVYNNIKRDQLIQFKGDPSVQRTQDFTNECIGEEVNSRKASYSLSQNGSSTGIHGGIDNPALEVSRETTPTNGYSSRNLL